MGGKIDLDTNGQNKIVFGRETGLPDPPLFVWCIKASLLKEKKRCLIITFVDLCTFWLPSLLGTRYGHC